MYTLNNGWWFLSSGGSYPPVFTVVVYLILPTGIYFNNNIVKWFAYTHPIISPTIIQTILPFFSL